MTHRTKLSKWISGAGMTRAEFADMIGCDKSNVTRWCDGSRIPAIAAARKIEHSSDGYVSLADWGYAPDLSGKPGPAAMKAHMWEHDLSISGLARKMGVAPMSARHWVRGSFRPSPEMLWRINQTLGTTLTVDDFGA